MATEARAARTRPVIAAACARRAARSGAIWGLAFGVYFAASADGYAGLYTTAAARLAFARSVGPGSAVAAMLGQPHDLASVGGFTGWRTLVVVGVMGSIWAVLLATRELRGEEEAGRFELLLAGPLSRRQAVAQTATGMLTGLAALFAGTAAVALPAARLHAVHLPVAAVLYYCCAAVAAPALFLAIGALAAELSASRRLAAGLAGGLVGASYLVRFVADSSTSLGWLRWCSPLGWLEELRPLAGPSPAALLAFGGGAAVAGGLALYVAGRRDLGAAVLSPRDAGAAHLALLGGPTGLTARLVRPLSLAWWSGIALMAFIFGEISKSAGKMMETSKTFRIDLARLGEHGSGADVYLGVGFLVVSLMLCLLVAGHLTAARAEEASGRLDHLLVRAVGRAHWLAGRAAVLSGAALLGGLVAGTVGWLGTAVEHLGLDPGSIVAAGLNTLGPVAFVAGAGIAALAAAPRLVSAVTYGLVAWSFLLELVGSVTNANHFVLDTSLFHQMAAAPAATPDWTSFTALVGLGALLAGLGSLRFARRDLAGD